MFDFFLYTCYPIQDPGETVEVYLMSRTNGVWFHLLKESIYVDNRLEEVNIVGIGDASLPFSVPQSKNSRKEAVWV